MQLLHTSNLEVIDFSAKWIPSYAILSHTWEDGEVLFADINQRATESKNGYQKIRHSCEKAAANGYEYIWIDTCCIDQKSSAELQEAINSMFKWYARADVCYAYLADVSLDRGHSTAIADLRFSRWFKRGWTLQELLAPVNVTFLSREWMEMGTKITLGPVIADITGIDIEVLAGQKSLSTISVARRMYWASSRETTRREDTAYCLMGIFNVNMPLLYGEEDRAFIRLQEELIQHSNDHSIFAWVDSQADPDTNDLHGLLAESPACFAQSGDIGPIYYPYISNPCSNSNQGFRIDLHLNELPGIDLYSAALDCSFPSMEKSDLGILLKRSNYTQHQYARIKANRFHRVCRDGDVRTVYVPQEPIASHFGEGIESSVQTVLSLELSDSLEKTDHRKGKPVDATQVTSRARKVLANL